MGAEQLQEVNEEMPEGEVIDQMAEIKKEGNQFKLFGLYDVSDIKLVDPGMKRYINLEPKTASALLFNKFEINSGIFSGVYCPSP